MANTIKLKNSGTANSVPSSLVYGELGLNYADGKIYFKNLANTIVEFTGTPGIAVQATAPSSTSILWADTSVTGVGVVPVGGTTGQVLSKGSNTSYDAVWANVVTSSDLSLKANIASPTFTGTPLAPTANSGTNTTQIATTAFVTTAVSGATITSLDDVADVTITTAANGDLLKWSGSAWVNASGYALLSSPTFTGAPTLPTGTIATTQSPGANTTTIATTAFVTAGIAALVVDPLNNPKFSAIITMDVI